MPFHTNFQHIHISAMETHHFHFTLYTSGLKSQFIDTDIWNAFVGMNTQNCLSIYNNNHCYWHILHIWGRCNSFRVVSPHAMNSECTCVNSFIAVIISPFPNRIFRFGSNIRKKRTNENPTNPFTSIRSN